jgi:hypothetical protein
LHIERLIGPNGNVPVLIRDDDTNFFTKTDMLESVYSKAWHDGYKVCLSVVPFQKGIDDICVPPEIRQTGLFYSIEDNRALICYLKDKIRNQLVEVLQHGLSHDYVKGGRGEFGTHFSKNEDIKIGRNIIKKAFEIEPMFFVPPGEDLSKQNLRALLALGVIPIYRETFFDKFLRNSFVPEQAKRAAMKALMNLHNNSKSSEDKVLFRYIKPVNISIGRHVITWSLPKIVKAVNLNNSDSLFKLTDEIIESCNISRAPLCIINHYHLYYYDWNSSITKKDLFQSWRQLVNSLDRLGFTWKVSFSELYSRVKEIQDIYIVKTGSKITIESKIHIKDFSFRSTHSIEPKASVVIDKETNILTIKYLDPKTRIILYEK